MPPMAKVRLSLSTSLRPPSMGVSSYPMGTAFFRDQVTPRFPLSSRATMFSVRYKSSPLGPALGPAAAENSQSRKLLSPTTPLVRVTGAKRVNTGTVSCTPRPSLPDRTCRVSTSIFTPENWEKAATTTPLFSTSTRKRNARKGSSYVITPSPLHYRNS